MEGSETQFPTKIQLWKGAVLGTIAHALFISNHSYSPGQWWQGRNYLLDDEQGARGVLTFAGKRLVAAFCDMHSPRNPWNLAENYDPSPYWVGIPDDRRALAELETLQYLLDDHLGTVMPVITTAVWDDGERVTAAESWPKVVEHGAHLLRIQVMPPQEAILQWKSYYALSDLEMKLMRRMFEFKAAMPDEILVLNEEEAAVLVSEARGDISDSKELLAAIGIVVP